MYAGELPLEPSSGYRKRIEQVTWGGFIIYKSDWYTEPLTGLKKRAVRCICTQCKASYMMARCDSYMGHKSKPRAPFGFWDNEEAVWTDDVTFCEECGATVTAIHVGNIKETIVQAYWVMTAENVNGNAVLMGWQAKREIWKNGREVRTIRPYEAYVHDGKVIRKFVAYEMGMYGSKILVNRWEPRRRNMDSWRDSTLLMETGIWNRTSAENSGMEDYIQWQANVRPVAYLWAWTRYPRLEALTRAMPRYVNEILDSRCGGNCYNGGAPRLDVDKKAKRPGEMLGLNREEMRAFKDCPYIAIDIYREAKRHEKMKVSDMATILQFTTRADYIKDSGRLMKGLRYLEKTGRSAITLGDYWRMVEELGWEKTDAVIWPKDLKKAHDRAVKERNDRKDELEIKKKAKLNEKVIKRGKTLEFYAYEEDELFIRPVKDLEDLYREGRLQNHCVSTYDERIGNGEVAIFLIRKKSNPEAPYFTLQLNERKLTVVQNRGKGNCRRTMDVMEFEKRWLEHIRSIGKKGSAA